MFQLQREINDFKWTKRIRLQQVYVRLQQMDVCLRTHVEVCLHSKMGEYIKKQYNIIGWGQSHMQFDNNAHFPLKKIYQKCPKKFNFYMTSIERKKSFHICLQLQIGEIQQ